MPIGPREIHEIDFDVRVSSLVVRDESFDYRFDIG
jgi:hypothetical protein